MGYYTKYELEHEPKSLGHSPSIEKEMETLGSGEYDPFEDTVKWYEHEEDMKKLSLQFPDVLFTLSGEGEEAGDVWKKYFKNGKVQVAKAVLTIDAFDPKKLR
jgi:hypothetical protein